MRVVLTAFVLVLLTAVASAQFSMEPKKKKSEPPPAKKVQEEKEAESAFRRSQQLIPNSTAKPDPWKGAR